MGKLIYSMSVSLDGFMEGPDHRLDWVAIDEELHTFFNERERAMGCVVYGRRLYELMSAYWPTADIDPSAPPYVAEFSRIWKEKPKLVVSKTLGEVGWNGRLIRDNVADEVKQLKDHYRQDILVGGAAMASSLIRLGLVDEYRPVIHPVVLGRGTPFFPELDHPIDLRLVETRRFGSGAVYLRYQAS